MRKESKKKPVTNTRADLCYDYDPDDYDDDDDIDDFGYYEYYNDVKQKEKNILKTDINDKGKS